MMLINGHFISRWILFLFSQCRMPQELIASASHQWFISSQWSIWGHFNNQLLMESTDITADSIPGVITYGWKKRESRDREGWDECGIYIVDVGGSHLGFCKCLFKKEITLGNWSQVKEWHSLSSFTFLCAHSLDGLHTKKKHPSPLWGLWALHRDLQNKSMMI